MGLVFLPLCLFSSALRSLGMVEFSVGKNFAFQLILQTVGFRCGTLKKLGLSWLN